MRLVLASTSPYRRELLARLGLTFTAESPGVDETPLPGEDAERLVRRLAMAKADTVAARHADALVIGSDQVAVLDRTLLGKPGSTERACAQLAMLSGREVRFLTALALRDTRQPAARCENVVTLVRFRTLDAHTIARYVAREQPLDCAGSFKAESLGIALFERMDSDDPTALIGLPLIALSRMLREAGLDPITSA